MWHVHIQCMSALSACGSRCGGYLDQIDITSTCMVIRYYFKVAILCMLAQYLCPCRVMDPIGFPGCAAHDRNYWDIHSIFLVLLCTGWNFNACTLANIHVRIMPHYLPISMIFSKVHHLDSSHGGSPLHVQQSGFLWLSKQLPQSLNLVLNHLRVYVEMLIKLHVHTMPTLNNNWARFNIEIIIIIYYANFRYEYSFQCQCHTVLCSAYCL